VVGAYPADNLPQARGSGDDDKSESVSPATFLGQQATMQQCFFEVLVGEMQVHPKWGTLISKHTRFSKSRFSLARLLPTIRGPFHSFTHLQEYHGTQDERQGCRKEKDGGVIEGVEGRPALRSR